MGCFPSKRTLEQVDDSVHVMLKHDKKVAAKKGQALNTGYVPRAEHPLLQKVADPPEPITATEDDGGEGGDGGEGVDNGAPATSSENNHTKAESTTQQ